MRWGVGKAGIDDRELRYGNRRDMGNALFGDRCIAEYKNAYLAGSCRIDYELGDLLVGHEVLERFYEIGSLQGSEKKAGGNLQHGVQIFILDVKASARGTAPIDNRATLLNVP